MKTLEQQREARHKRLPNVLSPAELSKRAAAKVRHNLAKLAQDNVGKVQKWLDQTAADDGPAKALEIYLKMLEFSVPKLSRAEIVDDTPGRKDKLAQMSIAELQQLIREGVKDEARTIEGEVTTNQ